MKEIIKILYEIHEETGWRDIKAILGDKQGLELITFHCIHM